MRLRKFPSIWYSTCMASYERDRATYASVTDRAYHEIRQMIVSGRFGPEDQLVSRDLADELEMSRSPVTHALTRLKGEGLLRPGGGGRGGSRLVVAALEPSQVQDVYAVRAVLEALTAGAAARRQRNGLLAPAELTRLGELAERVEEAASRSDPQDMGEANLGLHQHISHLSGNQVAHEELGRLTARITVSAISNLHHGPRWWTQVIDHHRAIVDAITAGEPELAADAARYHVNCSARLYARAHQSPGPPAPQGRRAAP